MTHVETAMRFVPRDLDILKDVHLHTLLTFDQIWREHFAGRTQPTVSERLTKLCNEKLLVKLNTGNLYQLGTFKKVGTVYGMTAKALRLLESFGVSNVGADPVQIASSQVLHDVLLVEVVRSLLKKRDCTFINGKNILKSQVNPDGILRFSDGRCVAIELELTQKSDQRYRELITGYRLESTFDEVWYFVKSQGVAASLRAAITGYKHGTADLGKFQIKHVWDFIQIKERKVSNEITHS